MYLHFTLTATLMETFKRETIKSLVFYQNLGMGQGSTPFLTISGVSPPEKFHCFKWTYLNLIIKQAQLGVPHLRIKVELGFILHAGACQILNFAQNPRQSQSVQGTELNWEALYL